MRMRNWGWVVLGLLAISACGSSPQTSSAVPKSTTTTAAPVPVAAVPSEPVVAFASQESMDRLARSDHKLDFFSLSNHYEGQQNMGMCGPTSAVIVLNALRSDTQDTRKPTNPSLFPQEFAAGLPPGLNPLFRRYSQGIFFADERVTGVKKRETFYGQPGPDGKRDPGMQLRQLHEILLGLGVSSEIVVVDDKAELETIRQTLKGNLGRAGDYVIINYHRPALNQKGGGHISPLGAYDEASDSFLILDVNPNGKTWVWVRTDKLVEAMRSFDTIENRGFLLLSDSAP